MARVKRAMIRRTRIKNLRRRSKGFFLSRKTLRQAHQAVMRAQRNEFIGRKHRKRDFRRLWTQRINAAARINGLSYSRLVHGLKLAGVSINRKMLADLAVRDAAAFSAIVDQAKAQLS